MKIHLGYEIGSGKAAEVPLRHLAVTGQTQESGKTTTLEALISRSGLRAVAFVTKRAERSFQSARTIPPYFRERADWQFVSAILEATLRERLKFQRSWIIRVCKAAKSLSEVQGNVQRALAAPRLRGLDRSVYEELNAYLDLVLPQIERLPYQKEICLEPGINVMDLGRYTMELQALVIRSVLEWVYQEEENTIVIIPEAWEFIPQKRGSPVLLAAEQLIRKGAAAKNYVWLDSQDIAGVHKDVLRQVGVWILGVQREINEAKRTVAHIPSGSPKPKVEDIMQLGKGEFFVCFGREMHKVYVQPKWMLEDLAQSVARGQSQIPEPRIVGEDPMWKERYEELQSKFVELETDLRNAQDELRALKEKKAIPSPAGETPPRSPISDALPPTPKVETVRLDSLSDDLFEMIKVRLLAEAPQVLQLLLEKPELRVEVERPMISVNGRTLAGRLAQLLAEGFFNSAATGSAAYKELRERRGFGCAKPNVYRELDKLAEMGFMRKETGGYQAVPEMKINIVEK